MPQNTHSQEQGTMGHSYPSVLIHLALAVPLVMDPPLESCDSVPVALWFQSQVVRGETLLRVMLTACKGQSQDSLDLAVKFKNQTVSRHFLYIMQIAKRCKLAFPPGV